MASTTPKVTILDYTSAARVLAGRDTKKIENNTYLVRLTDKAIALRLHFTNIIVYYANGSVVLGTGGWRSNTTKDRLNKYSRASISQRNYEWFNHDGSPFTEGQEAN